MIVATDSQTVIYSVTFDTFELPASSLERRKRGNKKELVTSMCFAKLVL